MSDRDFEVLNKAWLNYTGVSLLDGLKRCKWIPNYEGLYCVNMLGLVWSARSHKWLKPNKSTQFTLYANGNRSTIGTFYLCQQLFGKIPFSGSLTWYTYCIDNFIMPDKID